FFTKLRRVIEFDKMQLNILPRSDMQIPGGISVGHVGYPRQFSSVEVAMWDFDPYHLYPGLSLTVYSPCQPETFESIFRNNSAFVLCNFLTELEQLFLYYRILQFCSKTLHN